ncbi:response regulator [Candidatus Nomurabacteria bacterium]|nr:response regulator [Candidatus Nomurabacteria bacterium]
MISILLVEDDAWLRELYGQALERLKDVSMEYAESAGAALKILDSRSVDLIILDIFLDTHSGVELLHELASYNDTRLTPVVILSAVSESDFGMDHKRWGQYGVVKYLYKPSTKPQDLVNAVELHFSKRTTKGDI